MSWHRADWQAAGDKVKAFVEAHPTAVGVVIAFAFGFTLGVML